jgi:hypothetical protein
MKNFLRIIVLGLFLSGCLIESKTNDLVGKKILCGEWSSDNEVLITKLPIDGYDFINKDYVVYYKMSETSVSRVGFSKYINKYKVNYDEIIIETPKGLRFSLNRSTGIRKGDYSNITEIICKPLNDDKNIGKMFNKIYKLRLKKLKF